MKELNLEGALRRFVRKFKLPGEAQKIDRLMEAFSQRYCQCNPKSLRPELAYMLSFAIILLNTDLHAPHNTQRMPKELFIANVYRLEGARDHLSHELLSSIYDSIAKQELTMEEENRLEYTLSAPDIEGILWKQSDRKSFRTWNRRWCVVANGCLYYFYSRKDAHPRGVMPLEDLTVRPLNRRGKFLFEITASEHAIYNLSRVASTDAIPFHIPDEAAESEKSTISQRTVASLIALSIDENPDRNHGGARRPSSLSLPLIKSAKFVKGQLVEGLRDRYLFQCVSEEERERWVVVLTECMRKHPKIIIEPPIDEVMHGGWKGEMNRRDR